MATRPSQPLTRVTISRSALHHNIRGIKKIIGNAAFMAVVKSNAYGHDAEIISRLCEHDQSVDWFGVAQIDEALHLRSLGIRKPILVLSYYQKQRLGEAIRNAISLVVADNQQLRDIATAAKKTHRKANVHVKVDTGAGRIGFSVSEAMELLSKWNERHVRIEGVFSHLSDAEDSPAFTHGQLEKFSQLTHFPLRTAPLYHIAASAAALYLPESTKDMSRIGITLYGLWPSANTKKRAQRANKKISLMPVAQWETTIAQVRHHPKGKPISYGRTYTTARDCKVAILPVGYYEGYDRGLSNKGDVLIHGKRCPVRGRICMNLTMVDVTHVPQAKAGDTVVLMGGKGKEKITADEIAAKLSTINYEVVARINAIVPRILIQ